jgi:hypothetical protein
MEGMSSPKVRRLLNGLVNDDSRYLEVGVWKGSTFISALTNHKPQFSCAIDDFSEFEGTEEAFRENCRRHLGYEPNLINADFSGVDITSHGLRDIDVYFYDGCHSNQCQTLALTHFLPALAREFIFVVDDWNWEGVRIGTLHGVDLAGLTVVEEYTLPARFNGDTEQCWNGIWVARLQKGAT